MVLKIKSVSKKLIVMLSVLLLGLVTFICFAGQVNVNAAESNTVDKTNKEIYNTDWTKANVKFFRNGVKTLFQYQTTHYIRITNENGEFIDNLTYLSASFEIKKGSKTYDYKVDKAITSDSTGFFKLGNMFSEEGQLEKITDLANTMAHSLKFKDDNGNDVEYEDCNYIWAWNFNVTKIVYLYVWYLDPNTGKQVAASFMPNGEHPMYNEDGSLKGIYNVNNELVEDCVLNDRGVPSKVTKLPNGGTLETPLVKDNDQQVGGVESDIFDKMPFIKDLNTGIDKLNTVLKTLIIIAEVVAGLIVLLYLVKFFKWLYRLIKGAIK